MTLKLDITGIPPTAKDIQAEIAYQKRRFWWVCLLGLLWCVFVSYLLIFANFWVVGNSGNEVTDVFAFTMKEVQAHHERVAQLSSLLTFIIFFINFFQFDIGKDNLTALDLSRCEKALALSSEHPEINAYRLAVIKQRALVNADLDAIEQFPKEREQRLAKDKLQQDYDALHKA